MANGIPWMDTAKQKMHESDYSYISVSVADFLDYLASLEARITALEEKVK